MNYNRYTIVLEPAEEGGYNVIVPALPGCFTQGDTYEEAIAMARDAIGLWLTALADEGQAIPVEPESFAVQITHVDVALPAA